jgi:hypothetical protein
MREFVALMAALMASNALAIDAMLPALTQPWARRSASGGQPAPAGDHAT